MAEYSITLHVNLAAVTSHLQRVLQGTIDLTSFGLMAAERAQNEEGLKWPGAWFQLSTAGNEALDFDGASADFKQWVVAAGLRDGIEAVGYFLEEVRKVCAAWSFSGRPSILGEEWISKMEREPKKFHRLGLPDKMEFLRKDYGADAFLPDSADEVLSINDARNCLVHRRGIVADRDLNMPDGLLVRWRKVELVVRGPGGERVIVPPATINAGEALAGREGKASKLFRLGESVSFSPQEFAEMCWTLLWFGKTIVQRLEAYGKEQSIRFTGPQPAAKAEGG